MHLGRMSLAIIAAALTTPFARLMGERNWNRWRATVRQFARLKP
jgi:hypothetical protein